MSTASNTDIESLLTPNHVDMSQLPAPKIIEELSFEDIFEELLVDFKAKDPTYDALVESDPVIIALECAAYREVLLRNRINEAAKASLLAYATGSDLDNHAAFYGLVRQDGESDERLRYRTQLAAEALTTAGSEKAYLFHTLSADPRVKSASVKSPDPGEVLVTIMSTEDDGVASEELIETVENYLSSEDVRPMTDQVTVQGAEMVEHDIQAQVYLYLSPSMSITEQECRDALDRYLAKNTTIGNVIAKSGIFDALHTEGVQKVTLTKPENDVETTKEQAPKCTNITLQFITIDESE